MPQPVPNAKRESDSEQDRVSLILEQYAIPKEEVRPLHGLGSDLGLILEQYALPKEELQNLKP